MKRWGVAFVVLVVLAVASTGRADIILPDLPVGSQYQLIFVTAGKRDGTSPDISVYNNFVTAEAALNPELPDTTWHAVASTVWGVQAKDNAPSGGFPVYNTQGILVAPADTGLYILSLLSPILYDQFGVPYDPGPWSNAQVWTGSTWRGDWLGDQQSLGAPGAPYSSPGAGSAKKSLHGRWMEEALQQISNRDPLYALSDPITVMAPIPEPTTLIVWSLLGLSGAGLGCWRRRRQ